MWPDSNQERQGPDAGEHINTVIITITITATITTTAIIISISIIIIITIMVIDGSIWLSLGKRQETHGEPQDIWGRLGLGLQEALLQGAIGRKPCGISRMHRACTPGTWALGKSCHSMPRMRIPSDKSSFAIDWCIGHQIDPNSNCSSLLDMTHIQEPHTKFLRCQWVWVQVRLPRIGSPLLHRHLQPLQMSWKPFGSRMKSLCLVGSRTSFFVESNLCRGKKPSALQRNWHHPRL